VDLYDDGAVERLMSFDLKDVTVAYWMAYVEKKNERDSIEFNGTMFRNFLDALVEGAPNLKHIVLQVGTKYYGSHKGPIVKMIETPYPETDERHEGLNFYYTQEDYLKEIFELHSRTGHNDWRWSYSVTRPNTIIGFAAGNFMNAGGTLAAYALVLKEVGKPLIWPGSYEYWTRIVDISDANTVARFEVFLSERLDPANVSTHSFQNQGYNIVNGDVFRWSRMWPRIAEYFGMQWEGPRQDRCKVTVAQQMAEVDAVGIWRKIAEREELLQSDVTKVATWDFLDMEYGRSWDVISSMTKGRNLGWTEYMDSEACFFRVFNQMKEEGYLPRSLSGTKPSVPSIVL